MGSEMCIRDRNVTERIGADIRSWKKSRIITERISARRNVTDRCGLGHPLRNNPDYGLYFNPYTSLIFSALDEYVCSTDNAVPVHHVAVDIDSNVPLAAPTRRKLLFAPY